MPPRNFTDSEEEQIAKIYLAGHSAKSIARAYGLSHHISIISALKRQRVKQRSPAERNRIYQVNHNAFDVIDSELTAYHWGFLYADGNVYKRSLRVALCEKDKRQVMKIKQFLKCEHPIKMMTEKLDGNEYGKAVLFVTSRHLTNRLRQLGVKKGRQNFKSVIDQLPEHLISHWIRGYFDGDGCCLTTAPILSFVGQRELLKWIRQQIADNAGTNPGLKVGRKGTKNIYGLYISGRLQLLNAADYIYKDATIWMKRKREAADTWR